LLRKLEEGRLSRKRLQDVARVSLKAKSSLVVVGLGSGSRRSRRSSGLRLDSSSLTGSLGFLCLATTFGLVGFNLCLDALLGFSVFKLLLALAGGFLDLFLARELLFEFLRFLVGLLADFL
jgi:hypothetical protein